MNRNEQGVLAWQDNIWRGVLLIVLVAVNWATCQLTAYGRDGCVENGPHISTNVYSCPTLANSPGVSPGSFCQHYGDAPTIPTVTPPVYSNGVMWLISSYDCTTNTSTSSVPIIFSIGPVTWNPPLPGAVTTNFTSTARVWVTCNYSNYCAPCPNPDYIYVVGTNGWVNIGSCSWGYALCDNPHALDAVAYECYHEDNNSGTICNSGLIIKDVISTSTCDPHPGGTCQNCNLTPDPTTPEELQYLYDGPCSNAVDASTSMVLWQKIYFDNCVHCSVQTYSNACTIGSLPPDAILDPRTSSKPTRKKIPCTL